MKCISFNTNSIRIRLHQLEETIRIHAPDVIGIQETKVTDGEFPVQEITDLGYHCEFIGQKTHYGVALLSKTKPVSVTKGFAQDGADAQKRFIAAEFNSQDGKPVHFLNGYFPQGESRDHPVKFPNKEKFYQDTLAHLHNHTPEGRVILMGDMNISHQDCDIGIGEVNRKRWLKTGKCSFLPEERDWLNKLLAWGLVDTFRSLNPSTDDRFSWFDYRSKGFEDDPKRGLRIDLILASTGLSPYLSAAGIDYEIRAMDKPSDHCPIWAEFKDIQLV
ncbi:MAG TPA: exodeoxyribonuclease III [Cellvibrionaceae bacterium]|nr:exodeoxyribonuclease III [Cellvibrionaceae bacterium]